MKAIKVKYETDSALAELLLMLITNGYTNVEQITDDKPDDLIVPSGKKTLTQMNGKPTRSVDFFERVIDLVDRGYTARAIAKLLEVPESSMYVYVARARRIMSGEPIGSLDIQRVSSNEFFVLQEWVARHNDRRQ